MFGPTFIEFFSHESGPLVAFLQKIGFEREQAKDAASEAMARAYESWPQIDRSPRGWVRTVAYRIACGHARRVREEPFRAVAGGWAVSTSYDVDVVENIGEPHWLRRLVQRLPHKQRLVMAWHLDGFDTKEISDRLDMSPSTVRSNLRYGRNTLRRLSVTDEQGLPGQAGQQLWEAFQRGDPLPVEPRLVILKAWNQAKAFKVDPEHGNVVDPLGWDEVKRRRCESPLAACSWALDALAELGTTTGQMMVVVDADGVVLWRSGGRGVLQLADQLGFVEGTYWDIAHAGANGIALALTTGRTVTVCGWEHYVQAQHGLSCVAVPVRDPQDARTLCVLNLTGMRPVHHAILREIDTIAMRLHRQLRTSRTPHRTQLRRHSVARSLRDKH